MFWGSMVQFLTWARYLSFLQSIQNKSGTHPASYSMGNVGSFRRSNAASLRWGWVVNATPRSFYRRERDRVSIVQEAGWASGMVWMGMENLTPMGCWTTDHWSCRKSLYWLSCPNCRHYTIPTVIPNGLYIEGFYVLTAMLLRCQVSWDVILCYWVCGPWCLDRS